jgi:hypothetical protein
MRDEQEGLRRLGEKKSRVCIGRTLEPSTTAYEDDARHEKAQ